MVSSVFVIVLCMQQASANDVNDIMSQPLSVSALKEHVMTPRIFTVTAYIIEKYDKCPPCPPNAVCETCVLGIYVADDNRPRKPGTFTDDGLYLRTKKAQDFQIGIKYEFIIRYRLEKNAAGAWLQTGPELIDFAPVGSWSKRKKPPNNRCN